MVQFQDQIVQEMIISYPTGGTAIQIGPGATLEFFDTSGNLIMELSPPRTAYQTLIQVNQGGIVFEVNNQVNQSSGVGFEWSNGNGEVFANVTPDGNNVLQLGLNGAPYIAQSGISDRQRIFMGNDNLDIGPIVGTTQATDEAHLKLAGNTLDLGVWSNGTELSRLIAFNGNPHDWYLDTNPSLSKAAVHWQPDSNGIVRAVVNNENWNALTLINGFSNGSQAGWNSGIRYRRAPSDGMVFFDGIVACPASPANKVMGTFPAGYRPSSNQVYWAIAPGNTPKITDIQVSANGDLAFLGDIGNPAGASNIYVTGAFPTT